MVDPIDAYISIPLSKISDKPVGEAQFKEPIFKHGKFQNKYITVTVQVYPITSKNPKDGMQYTAVRFGQMDSIRFVESKNLMNFKRFTI